jgi:phage gp16-like protein
MNTQKINAQELSSRKLWQLAEAHASKEISADDLTAVIAELAKRCHDMEKLQQIDQLKDTHQG